MTPSAAATTTAIRRVSASPDLFEPAHILFKARGDDAVAYAKAVAQAEAVLAQTPASNRTGSTVLARSLSDCPSATEGGRLGQVVRGETTPEFETFWLPWSPARSAQHRCARAMASTCSVWTAGSQARRCRSRPSATGSPAYLEERTWRRAVAQYIALVAGQARIAGFDLPAATSPLVQ